MALSDDLRKRVVEAVVVDGLSRNAVAKLFKVSIASAVNFRYVGALACVTRVLHQMPTIGDLDCLWERLGGLRSRRT